MTPLAGRRIVLTRTPEDAAAWAGPLTAVGAFVTNLPCIRTETVDDTGTRDALEVALATADWLILTSRRGVDALTALLPALQLQPRTRIAVVGAATAATAEAALGRVDHVGTGGTARALGSELVERGLCAPGQRIVAALAVNAGSVLEDTLEAAGVNCTRVDVYRTIPHPPVACRRPMAALEADGIVFSSPSTVEGFVNQVDVSGGCTAFSIGPSTSAALRRAGIGVAGEAASPDIEALIAIIDTTLNAPATAGGGNGT